MWRAFNPASPEPRISMCNHGAPLENADSCSQWSAAEPPDSPMPMAEEEEEEEEEEEDRQSPGKILPTCECQHCYVQTGLPGEGGGDAVLHRPSLIYAGSVPGKGHHAAHCRAGS